MYISVNLLNCSRIEWVQRLKMPCIHDGTDGILVQNISSKVRLGDKSMRDGLFEADRIWDEHNPLEVQPESRKL